MATLPPRSRYAFPPWYCSPCVSPWILEGAQADPTCPSQFCGFWTCRAAREPYTTFDPGQDTPFLPSSVPSSPGDLPCPPALPTSSPTYPTAHGIHSPVCGGRCLVVSSGPDRLLWVTALMLLVPTVLYVLFVVPPLAQRYGPFLPAFVLVLAFCAHLFLALTFFTEPGILPTLSFQESSSPGDEEAGTHTYVFLGGRYYDRRLFRAQKSRFTGSMLENFDHFCPWVSNAVARRNYRYFFLFLVASLCLGFSVIGSCVAVFIEEHGETLTRIEHQPAAFALGAYALVLTLSLTSLATYHCRILSRGVSTAEDLKARFPKGNPYWLGCTNHWALLLCGPHWPSRVASSGEASTSQQGREHDLTALLLSPSTPAARASGGPPSPLGI